MIPLGRSSPTSLRLTALLLSFPVFDIFLYGFLSIGSRDGFPKTPFLPVTPRTLIGVAPQCCLGGNSRLFKLPDYVRWQPLQLAHLVVRHFREMLLWTWHSAKAPLEISSAPCCT